MKKIVILLFLINLSFNQKVQSQENKIKTAWYLIKDSEIDFEITLKGTETKYSIDNSPIISIENFKTVKLINSKTRPYHQIQIKFDSIGTKIWEKQTEKLIGKEVGFIMDGELIDVLLVRDTISVGIASFSSNNDDKIELKRIYTVLRKEMESLNQ